MSAEANKIKIVVITILLALHPDLFSQTGESVRYFRFIVGGGAGYYLNNFQNVYDENVKNSNPFFTSKITWHPEHRLEIGLESGFYSLYSTDRIEVDDKSLKFTTKLRVYPVFLNLSMRVVNNVSVSIGTGWCFMDYFISSNKKSGDALTVSTISKANYTAGIIYNRPFNKHFDYGTELKFLYIGKTWDKQLSISFFVAYKFLKTKVDK